MKNFQPVTNNTSGPPSLKGIAEPAITIAPKRLIPRRAAHCPLNQGADAAGWRPGGRPWGPDPRMRARSGGMLGLPCGVEVLET